MIPTLKANLMEADGQTRRMGSAWDTLRRIAAELDMLGVPYAVAGGIALQHHGILRSTRDIDLLIGSVEELDKVHARLVGHGYAKKTPGSRHLRDEDTRVRIEFLIAGEYPGDGQPKPVTFPRPLDVAIESDDGLRIASLEALIEMKLTGAKSAPHRIKDRADVLELIHGYGLTGGFADRLNEYVRHEFRELTALPPPGEHD